jgi:flavin reductase (DIM6/NTAB) family NADH-FMN oxidoreductase RutF
MDGIVKSGYFSVNIPSAAQVRETDFCGIASGRDNDKSALFTAFYSAAGPAPLIEECPLNFLCKVCDSTEIRGFTMFFGEIAAAFASEDCLTEGQPDPLKIDPIIMMAFAYCNLAKVIGRPFSEGKKLNG